MTDAVSETVRMQSKRGRITEREGTLFGRFIPLGFKLDNPDTAWVYDEEPHVQRRQVQHAMLIIFSDIINVTCMPLSSKFFYSVYW